MSVTGAQGSPHLTSPQDRSLEQDLRGLAEDARALAQAEFAYQKSRASYAGKQAGRIAMLLGLAAVLAFFALMALVVGTVIALGPVLGQWGAMLAVTGGLILIAAICLALALSRFTRMKRVISDDEAG